MHNVSTALENSISDSLSEGPSGLDPTPGAEGRLALDRHKGYQAECSIITLPSGNTGGAGWSAPVCDDEDCEQTANRRMKLRLHKGAQSKTGTQDAFHSTAQIPAPASPGPDAGRCSPLWLWGEGSAFGGLILNLC